MIKKEGEKMIGSMEELSRFASELLSELEDVNVICLSGELGAGKTTFSQAILSVIGATGPFTSPTFVIMKDYAIAKPSSEFKRVFHFDCYRVGAADLIELGWEEIYKNKENLILVEWPEKIETILPKHYLRLDFEIVAQDTRKIKWHLIS